MSLLADLALRAATTADADAIAEIWHASASLPTVGPAAMPTSAELRARVETEMAGRWVVTLALRGDRAVGFLAIVPGENILDQLFVRPGELGGGIGRALLSAAMAAMPHGFTLFTRLGNARARRFYERAGLVALREDLHPRSHDPIVHYGWHPANTPR